MSSSLEQQIREAVLQYTADLVSLRQFQDWFASQTWDSLAETDAVRRLVNEIDLLLAEFSSGHWTDQEVKSKLREYRPVIMPGVGGVVWTTAPLDYVYFRTNEPAGVGTTPASPRPRIDINPVAA